MRRRDERLVRCRTAVLLVDLVVVAHVVAVRAARRGGEVRRRVDRRDAEPCQIRDDVAGGSQREPAMNLEAIGADRHVPRALVMTHAFGQAWSCPARSVRQYDRAGAPEGD